MSDPRHLVVPRDMRRVVQLPASKSISNRALVINVLAGGEDLLQHVSDCDDTRVMLRWLTAPTVPETIDIGAAGTAMRFSAALLAVMDGEHVLTGTERMQNRPIGILVEALRQLGAEVRYLCKEGFPPIAVTGMSLLGRRGATSEAGVQLTLNGSVSSQYISALLMIAPVLRGGLTLHLEGDVVSRPYIDMTLSIMRDYGAQCGWQDERTIRVAAKVYEPRPYYVESDWSAASYWYEAVALSADVQAQVCLPGLLHPSLQGDAGCAELFAQLGVQTSYTEHEGQPSVVLNKGGRVAERLDFDFVRMPDLAQTFVVTCCLLGVPFHFTGLQSLRIKETDRIAAMQTEMRKLGYVLVDRNDSELLWNGERCTADIHPAIDTYDDHRMAMAFAPAVLKLGRLTINNPHVVTKSYPGFWEEWDY